LNRLKVRLDKDVFRAALAFALACSATSASAQLVATTARQSSSGSLKFLVY
jgi:hypothetical protein